MELVDGKPNSGTSFFGYGIFDGFNTGRALTVNPGQGNDTTKHPHPSACLTTTATSDREIVFGLTLAIREWRQMVEMLDCCPIGPKGA